MNISKDSRLYAYLAAACFAFMTAVRINLIVVHVQAHVSPGSGLISETLAYIIFFIALVVRNKNIFLIAAACNIFVCIGAFVGNIRFPDDASKPYFIIGSVILLLASIAVALISYFSITHKFNPRYMWFLPAVLYVFYLILYIFKFTGLTFYFYLYKCIVPTIAYALAGLWLKVADHFPTAKPVKAAPVASPSRPSQAETIERLKEYKSLLDCGAITEEEFQEKKKEILNL